VKATTNAKKAGRLVADLASSDRYKGTKSGRRKRALAVLHAASVCVAEARR